MARFRYVKHDPNLIQEEPSTRDEKRRFLSAYAKDIGGEILKFFAEKIEFRGYPHKGEALIDLVVITPSESMDVLRLIEDPQARRVAQRIMDPFNTYGG